MVQSGMKRLTRLACGLAAASMVLCVSMAWAQPTAKPAAVPAPAGGTVKVESLVGVWDGAAQTANGELGIRVTLALKDGKLTGSIESQMGVAPISAATFNGELLEFAFDLQGMAGGMTAKVAGNRIEGSWSVSSDSGSFVVTRPAPAGSDSGAAAEKPAAKVEDPLTGVWDGAVDISGQSMPFSLTLKMSGEAVTGEITSGAGAIPLSSCTWKEGTLSLSFPYMGGEPVVMGGKIVDGKLTGVVNYNGGEMQGTFTASKKK